MKRVLFGMFVLLAIVVGAVVIFFGNSQRDITPDSSANGNLKTLTYLPLGDSYTIGEQVAEEERWPNQLAKQLEKDGISLQINTNPARSGYTTTQLIADELPLVASTGPDFVSILIGQNDYTKGVPVETFSANLKTILDEVQKNVPTDRILLVTIPDFGKTPVGASFGKPEDIAAALATYNAVIKSEAEARKTLYADVFDISQQVTASPTLLAVDHLHPSGKQYELWVERIYPIVKPSLTR